MSIKRLTPMTLSGRNFKVKDFKLIKEIVTLYPNLSRSELAKTVCELFEWHQSNGEPKYQACLPILEKLEQWGAYSIASVICKPS